MSPSGSPGASPSPSGTPTSGPTATTTPTRPPTPRPTLPPTPAPTPAPTPDPTAVVTPIPPTPAPAGWDPNKVTVGFSTVANLASLGARPLAVTNAGDGSGRLFVAEQGGKVYIVTGNSVNPTPFLDISGLISGGGEQGLLGIAFHPTYPSDNRVFVDYTRSDGDIVISSFLVDAAVPAAVPTSRADVLTIEHSSQSNHNGGGIAFGPDGFLYISTGDGGGGGDPYENGQDTASLLGKILRLDVDHPSGGRNYGVPGSNPFANEVWLYGLRNPFRFSFDRSTGDLWIGDVGQGAWEEIDVARAGVGGLNFGWDDMEGNHCYEPSAGCATSGRTVPVVEYPHVNGHCAVIGGHVYRGSAYPSLRGGYVFSDECSGYVWALDPAGSGPEALVYVGNGAGGIAGYGEDEAGELYAADLGGRLYRVTAAPR